MSDSGRAIFLLIKAILIKAIYMLSLFMINPSMISDFDVIDQTGNVERKTATELAVAFF